MELLTAEEFKNMVKGSGITVRAVREKCGVSSASISRWGDDTKGITVNVYTRLYDAYKELLKEKVRKAKEAGDV